MTTTSDNIPVPSAGSNDIIIKANVDTTPAFATAASGEPSKPSYIHAKSLNPTRGCGRDVSIC